MSRVLAAVKIVIMIPAFNEAATIAEVIEGIPRSIPGTSGIEVMVFDDGSDDETRNIAKNAGADLVVSHRTNRGLAAAFRTGLRVALAREAAIIVNTDADCQYDQSQIPSLVKPIVEDRADVVLGSRFKGFIEEMPIRKKIGNLLATFVTRLLSGFNTSDAQSGFRAYSREAAESLRIISTTTYVQETIIRPARMGYRIVEIPITFYKRNGESRLVKSIWGYAFKVLPDLIRCYIDTFGKSERMVDRSPSF